MKKSNDFVYIDYLFTPFTKGGAAGGGIKNIAKKVFRCREISIPFG